MSPTTSKNRPEMTGARQLRIGIQTWGSYGDVRPFLAIAGGLAAAGHRVTMYVTCIDDYNLKATAEKLGIQLKLIGIIDMASRSDAMDIATKIIFQKNPVSQLKAIMGELFIPHAEEMYRAALSLCDDNDVTANTCCCKH